MIPYILEAEFFLRIVLASICGILIGFERSKRLKEAGVRTHCMVACGAALIMIVSKYGFSDLQGAEGYLFGTNGADASRIASQVVSGVGFLGAGVIFRTGLSIKGLTTAAGLWTTAAVGLALGSGMYIIGISGTALIVIEQFLMHRFHIGNDAFTLQEIKVRFQDSKQFREYLFHSLEARGGIICNCSVSKSGDGEVAYTVNIRIKDPIHPQELQEMMDRNEEIISFSV
ncbi:MgtC/SapB family protein [Lawsonibacter sp. LCP25S3_G6]|uniref:MgtC/SapB family protein n=1 Tax=unclassified Lawsonibacter TaxID=2617946 RepID=UPI003F998FDA